MFDPSDILNRVFLQLRRGGVSLGVGELLAALRAVEGGFGAQGLAELKAVVRLLWWHSPQTHEFDLIWDAALATVGDTSPPKDPSEPPSALALPERPVRPHDPVAVGAGKLPATSSAPLASPRLTALPMRVPFPIDLGEDVGELHTYWPLSRRQMTYLWRYLRRPVPRGPQNILDVDATVEAVARQGFFLAPVYRRSERNDAHLILLIDQGGSMVPFHRFSRELVETASSRGGPLRRVDVFYFHNVPPAFVYRDPHLTVKADWEKLVSAWTNDTSVLLVSDAGAARGQRNRQRIRDSAEFLAALRRHTTLVAWLNPMPTERWQSTSAQIVAQLVPMFQMDPAGFSHAIDVLRGHPASRTRFLPSQGANA